MEKLLATKVGKELTRAVLAHRKDIEVDFDGEHPYILTEDYEDFIKGNPDKKKPYFKQPVPAIRYTLAQLFVLLIEEAKCITKEDAQDLPVSVPITEQMNAFVEKSEEQSDDTVSRYMFDAHLQHPIGADTVLSTANDTELYFKTKTRQLLPDFNDCPVFLDAIANIYISFIKSLGKFIGDFIWEDHITINLNATMGWLRQLGANDELLAKLKLAIPVSTPKNKKQVGTPTTSPTASPIAPADATPPADATQPTDAIANVEDKIGATA